MNLSELRTALQERREDYSQSDAKLNRRLNQTYLDICSRRKWGWLREEHSHATTAPFVSAAAVGVIPAVGISVLGTQNGNTTISVQNAAGGVVAIPTNTLGKVVRIEDDFYRVENIYYQAATDTSVSLVLDRPLRCTVTNPVTGATEIHYIKVLYNEVALPVGAITVVETSLLAGGATSYGTPLSMGAIQPINILHLGRDVEGKPTSFSVVRKDPIPTPRVSPTVVPFYESSAIFGDMLEIGKYTYWITYIDETTGAESALGPPTTVEITTTTPDQTNSTFVTLPRAREDLGVRLYRSTLNGGIPYETRLQGGTPGTDGYDYTNDDFLTTRGPESASTMFLQLYPVPDGEYVASSIIQTEAKPMGADNDRPLFDAQYHGIILDGAEALMLEASEEQGRSGQARQRYEMGIARMIQMDRLNQQSRVIFSGGRKARGKPTWWYGAFKPSGT